MPPATSRTPSQFSTAAGPLATEARLLERLAELAAEARADPTLLQRPVRVVVPSASLRIHVCERLARVQGSALGVSVQTLPTLASEILHNAGVEAPRADAWIEVLLRREARAEPDLREAFDEFRDGYRSASGTVRDLLDAGFEPTHLDGCLELIEGLRLAGDERARAQACLRVASAAAVALATDGLAGRAERLRLAREALGTDPERCLPTRALLIHGFADATGRAVDLLERLVLQLPTEVLMDRPADPRSPAHGDLGVAFCERLSTRLAQACSEQHECSPAPASPAQAPAAPAMFRAPGAGAEAREVAVRIRRLLAEGAVPERIGVVARDLAPHAVAVRAQFRRLGVPFSGLDARAPLDGPGRRLHALLELLDARAQCPVERWLDAVRDLPGSAQSEEPGHRPPALNGPLRLGLRVLGTSRVGELAALDRRADKDVRLPLVTGTEPRSEDDPRSGPKRVSARLPARDLAVAVTAAGSLCRRLDGWPDPAPLATHLTYLEQLRREELGWRADDEAERRVRKALAELDVPPTAELELWEAALLLRRTLLPEAAQPLGGAGGGVQVLGVTEARARTFEQLFVVGLNRGSFPRVGSEDALLSDDVRGALSVLLPDVPIKARSRYEERYLFAQLLASAPEVTLSWQFCGEDGKAQVVSPLVERLLGNVREPNVHTAQAVLPLDALEELGDAPRTSGEIAALAGLRDGLREDPEAQGRRMAAALAETVDAELAQTVACARARILAAFEAGSLEPVRLAPWLGFLGPRSDPELRPDPTRGDVFVTQFESVARCPWQTVLRRFLALEVTPDPLQALPAIESLALGQVVHGTLQSIIEEATLPDGALLSAVLTRTPVAVPWPAPERLDALLLERARREAQAHRSAYPGFARVLAEYARPYVERARELLAWDSAGATVLGAEIEGVAQVELEGGAKLDVRFKADLVERREGEVLLTDFKTGAEKTAGKLASTHLPRGELLQALAYALGAAAAEPVSGAGGRYLFLGPKVVAAKASVDAGPWQEHVEDFKRAVEAVAVGWSAGTFFPRLVEPEKEEQPKACDSCDVAQACLVGDSGARRALIAFAGPAGAAPAEFKGLWDLARRKVEAPKKGRAKSTAKKLSAKQNPTEKGEG